MKITLLVVGKTTDQRLQTLIEDYQQRLKHYVPFEMVVIPDLRNAKALTQAQIKEQEGIEILRRITPSMDVILLDEHGREYRSIEYAQWIQKKMAAGRDVTFIVGGPYGFSTAVYERADGKISLSKMTFSHQMIRLFFTEQIEEQIEAMVAHYGRGLRLHLHPFIYAYISKGWISTKRKWTWKYGVRVIENQKLGMLDAPFFDRKGVQQHLPNTEDKAPEKQ